MFCGGPPLRAERVRHFRRELRRGRAQGLRGRARRGRCQGVRTRGEERRPAPGRLPRFSHGPPHEVVRVERRGLRARRRAAERGRVERRPTRGGRLPRNDARPPLLGQLRRASSPRHRHGRALGRGPAPRRLDVTSRGSEPAPRLGA